MDKLHISKSELMSDRCGEILYIHGDSCDKSSAFDADERSFVAVLVPRTLGAVDLKIEIFDEKCENALGGIAAEYYGLECGRDIFKLKIDARSLQRGLYFYKIVIKTVVGILYADGSADKIRFSDKDFTLFQLSVSKFAYGSLKFDNAGVIYHIFVDRFTRDDKIEKKSGATFPEDWSVIPEFPEYPGAFLKNNTFYGGTLNSAAKRLDYIKSLGVNMIYLSPIFESPSNHKYDTADYMKVDSMLGGDSALKNFINKAAERGISVILDGVFNHTGADSIYFNKYGTYDSLGAYQSKKSKYYNWYTFTSYPDKYEAWWGIEILPRINTGNRDFENYILNKVIKKYRSMGIAGLRLDVADELSDGFIAKIKSALSSEGDSILFGEVWEDASNKIAYGNRKKYYLGDELDGVMNYPLRRGIIDYFRCGRTDSLRYALTDIINNAPKRIRDLQMNILGTHDTERILTALGGKPGEGKSNSELAIMKMSGSERSLAVQRLISAYTVLATLPGIPTVFYGDEAGLEGYSDPFNRMPYPKTVNKKILNHYKKIGQIRNSNPVYKNGDYELLALESDFLAFLRSDGECNYITVCNRKNQDVRIEFSSPASELISDVSSKKHTVRANTSLIFKTTDDHFYTTQEI